MKNRLHRLQRLLKQHQLDALLVTQKINRNYLSGFTGTSCTVMAGVKQSLFVTDFRYAHQAKDQVHGFTIKISSLQQSSIQSVITHAKAWKYKRLGFESAHLTYAAYQGIIKQLSGTKIELIPVEGLVEEVRMIKDANELKLIKKANDISLQAFTNMIPHIKVGVKESDLALAYEMEARKLGADGLAFDTIVASGYRSAYPHGVAGNKRIKKNEFITIDFGVVYQGYHSDCTRTFIVGKPSAKQKDIYTAVQVAQQAALAQVRPGISTKELDTIARDIITQSGYGDCFGHGLGHGVGMEIHEAPRLSQISDIPLQPGMVITVEPGIYLESFGGVRIEDLVIVTDKGYKVLSKYTKELVCL